MQEIKPLFGTQTLHAVNTNSIYIHTIACWGNCQCYTCIRVHCYESNLKTGIANLVNLSLGKSQTLSGSPSQKSLTKHKETLLSTLVFRLRFTKPQSKLPPRIHSPAQVWLQTLLCSSWHLNRICKRTDLGWMVTSCLFGANSVGTCAIFKFSKPDLGDASNWAGHLPQLENRKTTFFSASSLAYFLVPFWGGPFWTIYSGRMSTPNFQRRIHHTELHSTISVAWFFGQPKRVFRGQIKVAYCSQVIILEHRIDNHLSPCKASFQPWNTPIHWICQTITGALECEKSMMPPFCQV